MVFFFYSLLSLESFCVSLAIEIIIADVLHLVVISKELQK